VPKRALPSKARQRGECRSERPIGRRTAATIVSMADQIPSQPLDQQLREIGAQLAWVRDYL